MNSQQGTGEVQFDGAELVLRFTQPYPYPVVYSARLRKTSDEPASEVPPWDDLESPT